MDLAGDPNKNENYETVYIWLLYYNTSNTERSIILQILLWHCLRLVLKIVGV